MSNDEKKAENSVKELAEAAKRMKELIDDTGDIIPGLGMMIHGIANAVVKSMAPPEKLVELKESQGPDFKLSQKIIEDEYPEIAEEIENKGKEMAELFGNCKALMEMSPKEVCDQAVKLVRHHNMVKMSRDVAGTVPEGWSQVNGDSEEGAEEGCEDVDAPLKNGWASKCKGNG